MEDLDRAIRTNEDAVDSTPNDHPSRAICLNNLGNTLHRRFERTGSIDDLDRAIVTKEQAVESTPNDHIDRALNLNNLGLRTAHPIRANGIDGRPRSCNRDEREGDCIRP